MRLTSLRLYNFGLFRNQELELSPLTILFGANGSGKSTILDAIGDALTLSAVRMKIQEALDESDDLDDLDLGNVDKVGLRTFFGSAVVYATLEDRKISGSSDERIMSQVLWKNIQGIDESEFSYLDPYEDCPPLKDLMLQREAEMVHSGTRGTLEARTHIATYLLEHSFLAFGGLQASYQGNWGLVCRELSDEIIQYADTFEISVRKPIDNGFDNAFFENVSDGDADDELLSAVSALKHGVDAIVTLASGEAERELSQGRRSHRDISTTLFRRIRPLPMRLEFDPQSLDLELEAFVDKIASRLTLSGDTDSHRSWLTALSSPRTGSRSNTESGSYELEDHFARALNSLSPEDESEVVRHVPPRTEVFVLSPLIKNAVERIEAHANSIAPKFLRQDSQIEIEIISPTEWRPNAPRLRTTLNEGGRRFSLAFVGSGVARWASYSIRLACQELLNGTIVGDPNTDVLLALEQMSDDEAASYEDFHLPITFDEGSPYEEIAALEILPSKLDVVLLLDEPEAHLHPRAVASIGEWLLDISPRVASVVVATHHPSLFNLRGPSVQKHVVLRDQSESVSEPWNPASEELVAELARQIGLTAGDLFMMSRFVLFVEGPHDLVILEEFYGDLLRGCAVRLVPLHGAHNISLLATSEIVWQMGIPIGVLTDGTNIERIIDGKRSNHIEKLVDRMLRECKVENREVAAFGLELDDILFYLDDDITATFAKKAFPGWRNAQMIWKHIDQPTNDTANGAKFKKWITETYELPLDRDSVRDIARKCKEAGTLPDELSAKVSEIVSRTL